MAEYLILANIVGEGRELSVRSQSRLTAVRFFEIFTKYEWYDNVRVIYKGKIYKATDLEELP